MRKPRAGSSKGTIRPTGTLLLVRMNNLPSLTARNTQPDSLRSSRCDRLSLLWLLPATQPWHVRYTSRGPSVRTASGRIFIQSKDSPLSQNF